MRDDPSLICTVSIYPPAVSFSDKMVQTSRSIASDITQLWILSVHAGAEIFFFFIIIQYLRAGTYGEAGTEIATIVYNGYSGHDNIRSTGNVFPLFTL